ncbi:TPA: hypothetical protein MAZ91_000996 [Klebsiella pneumoniae]|uniref:hypothetical protein n=1 Tax=Klebsiella TaxID=570 RepID=UPI0012526996|nr:hypothetical protein [Klebsiella pneumoniae]VAR34007.1 Uncharacterised protein [Klebsiella pneumoniae]HBT0337798.1 hypothetical protein [Klebsiella pneumoniae]HDZ2037338.1 hypothetical protein [Klebsiella pneumoniae]HDZ9745323.1 hypothetical protein [Klebsiella pneumoniae]HDZ9799535.1 hypothetical protein [Klebsiella pneumoniae]
MTDITELALRLKLEAHRAVSNFNPQMNIKTRDLKELLGALEKTQAKADIYDMLRDDYGLREKGVGLADFVDWQAKRIAELESRAVTVENLQESAYRAGLAAGWNLGLANNNDGFNKCLAAHAAGIKVEAE